MATKTLKRGSVPKASMLSVRLSSNCRVPQLIECEFVSNTFESGRLLYMCGRRSFKKIIPPHSHFWVTQQQDYIPKNKIFT